MQKTATLITFFSFIALSITAQNRSSLPLISLKEGDYIYTLPKQNGKDSLRFGITQSGDTFTVQSFNQYQQLMYQNWHFDSLYTYDARQKVYKKYYHLLKNDEENNRVNYDYIKADSVVDYHSNGQIQHITVTSSERRINTEKAFDDKGKLIYSVESQGYPSINTYNIRRDGVGKICFTSNNVAENYSKNIKSQAVDTFFYANGQPQEISEFGGGRDFARQSFYTENGILIETLVDSLQGQPFMDNRSQLWGLKNWIGDTLLPPTYNEFKNFAGANRHIARKGDTYFLLRGDGSIVPTPLMSRINYLNEDIVPQYENTVSRTPPFAEAYQRRPRANGLEQIIPYFYYMIDNKTGIIDRNGKIILPPQYWWQLGLVSDSYSGYGNGSNFDHLVGALKYIQFSNQGHHGVTRRGYMNSKGVSIFNPPINFATYSGYKDYFVVSKNNSTNGQGLMTEQNKEILPFKFSYIRPVLFTPLFIVSKNVYSNEIDSTLLQIKYDYPPNNYQSTPYKYSIKQGIFNAETSRWILDSIYSDIQVVNAFLEAKVLAKWGLVYVKTAQYFIFSNDVTKQKGLIDNSGKAILSPDKDELSITENRTANLFYYSKKGKFSIFNPQKPQYKYAENYTFLSPFNMLVNETIYENDIYFLARNHAGKWGIIRGQDEEIVMPFDYDNGSIETYIPNVVKEDERKVIHLVKKEKSVFLHDNYFLSDTKLKK